MAVTHRLPLFLTILTVLLAGGCIRRAPVNVSCTWAEDAPVILNLATATDLAHVRDDAAFGEDLAIRYADDRSGHRSGNYQGPGEYGRTRDACMAALFAVIADVHGVRPVQVRAVLTRRSIAFDIGVIASFFLLYAWIVYAVAKWMVAAFDLQRFSSVVAVAVALVASGPLSVAGLVSGGLWSGFFEMIRIGNAHMSYRAFRVPWGQHTSGLFVACAVVFWLVMFLRYRIRDDRRHLLACGTSVVVEAAD